MGSRIISSRSNQRKPECLPMHAVFEVIEGTCSHLKKYHMALHELELTKKQLEEEQETLKRKNTVLSELFNHLDDEKKKVLAAIQINLETSVFPLLERAIAKDSSVKNLLEIVKISLLKISDPILQNSKEVSEYLTPKELQFCNLIRQGLTVKEIAALTYLSPRTIEKHREHIRKKLHIMERKTNLGAYLVNHLHK